MCLLLCFQVESAEGTAIQETKWSAYFVFYPNVYSVEQLSTHWYRASICDCQTRCSPDRWTRFSCRARTFSRCFLVAQTYSRVRYITLRIKVATIQEADVTSPHSNAGSSERMFSFELHEHFLHMGASMTEVMNIRFFYCCTVHFGICRVYSPTNALLLI